MNNNKEYKRKEYPIIIILFIFSVIAAIESLKIFLKYPEAWGAGFYPLLISGGMCLFCMLSLIEVIGVSKSTKNERGSASWREIIKNEIPTKTIIMAAIVLAYVLLFRFTNFYIATGVFLMGSISILGKSRGKQLFTNLLITMGSLATVWIVMEKIFSIHLSA